jgi:hypothetical protein
VKTSIKNIKKYKPITDFFQLIEDFVTPEELDTIDLGIFDRRIIKGLKIDNETCLTLKQTAKYISVPKKNIEMVWYRHKKDLQENLDYLQKVGTYYFPLRGILKLLKWTRSGFAERFYDAIVDYICDSFSPVLKSRYEQFRIMILKRDNYTCFKCGKTGNEVHHIWSQNYYPHLKYDPDNAMCACVDCNNDIAEEGRKRFTYK